jgi:hypothetical protein
MNWTALRSESQGRNTEVAEDCAEDAEEKSVLTRESSRRNDVNGEVETG